jgi:hypothetical protein
MPSPSPARKVLTVVAALAVAGVLLWFAGQALVISGTKASFTFVPAKAAPSGGPVTTTTSTSTTTTTGAR